jgi:hypothetical protein
VARTRIADDTLWISLAQLNERRNTDMNLSHIEFFGTEIKSRRTASCQLRRGSIALICTALVFSFGLEQDCRAQTDADSADWPTYNHGVKGWRYNQVEKTLSPDNISSMFEKWTFPPKDAKLAIGVVHATPTVVNHEVYFGTATFPAFYKLDKNGQQIWVYRNPAIAHVEPPTKISRLAIHPKFYPWTSTGK